MDQNELTALISQTAQLMEQFERRCEHTGEGLQSMVRQLDALTRQLPAVVSQSADASLRTLPAQVLHTTQAGLEQATHHYRERLNASGQQIADSTRVMAGQIQRLEKLHRHLVWKTVGAVTICFALLLAGGIWLSMHYTRVIERNQLSAQLMKAYNEADVTLCDGRLCAHVDPKAKRFGIKGKYVPVAPR
jgi:nitric oxide reductase activation protein